ncbi:MAG: DUF2249 domain-containing protein [Verrucomicrobia bacterium]|nr:DUF2249 domain-containing protein [Verrucomicrobiota bacterium]
MNDNVVSLDVREDIAQGREPFSKIMQTVARLKDGEKLLLIAPFEPVPLFGVLARQGFSHEAKPSNSGDWEVLFSRSSTAAPVSEKAVEPSPSRQDAPRCACACNEMIEVDARGLEPPQPLVVILEALGDLPAGAELRARTDRRPMHLYAQLEERGFIGTTEEQSDGSFITHIHRS